MPFPTEPGKSDMLTVNETGPDAGRYLFRTHETTDNAAVVRIDLWTGDVVTVFQRADIERLDGLRWTPWGTLLTGEEVKNADLPDPDFQTDPGLLASRNPAGATDLLDAYSGLAYEILAPTGPAPTAIARPDLGGLSHEGIEVDSQGHVYVMDEYGEGNIFRFVPDTAGDLSSGQLQVLRVVDGDPTMNPDRTGAAEWVDLDMAVARVNARGAAALVEGTVFNRPEDAEIAIRDGVEFLYVPITGESRVLSITLGGAPTIRTLVDQDTIDLATGSAVGEAFHFPDNLTVDASGALFVTEDAPRATVRAQGVGNDIWQVVDADGDGVAESVARFASLSSLGAEPTGVYIDPLNAAHMYVNVQHPNSGNDITLRIVSASGDFSGFSPLTASIPLGSLSERDPFDLPGGFSAQIVSERLPFDIVAHRGASGALPGNTLEAFRLALDQGADVLKTDLVVTADGHLILRHDVTLDDTTNVADLFGADRIATKPVDGHSVTGYFVDDFTLAEIRTLSARQADTGRDRSFDDLYAVPTFADLIALIDDHEAATGMAATLFPELRHPTYFRQAGQEMESLFLSALQDADFLDPDRTRLQSSEIESLIVARALFDAAGLDRLKIVQIFGNGGSAVDPDVPFDVQFNVAAGNDLAAIYGQDLLDALPAPPGPHTTWHDFTSVPVLEALRDSHADGLSLWQHDIAFRERLDTPVDADGDGIAEVAFRQTGEVSTLFEDAAALGLLTYVYGPKDEERFQSLRFDDTVRTPAEEMALFVALGANGIVADSVPSVQAGLALSFDETYRVGTGGDDTLSGTSADERISTGDGDDSVTDGGGDDLVFLGEGNDYVRVGGGADRFDGGGGTDYISYYDSTGGVTVDLARSTASGSWADDDMVTGFEGITGSRTGGDTITGTSGANRIKTYGGDDRVFTGRGDDTVSLGNGHDYVRADGGRESFDGGNGFDYISYYRSNAGVRVDLGRDTASGGMASDDTVRNFEGITGSRTGGDTLSGSAGDNVFRTYGGDDTVYAGNGDDVVIGGNGHDRFFAGGGDDRLSGGNGDDFLDGRTGDDILRGGNGADTFHFDLGGDRDIVRDFADDVDTIQFDGFTFATGQDAMDFASQSGGDVVFDFGGGDMLTVENTTVAMLGNDWEMV